MHQIAKWNRRMAEMLVALGSFMVFLMAIHVAADIGSRYLLNSPLPATLELVARYYMIGAVFLPMAYVQLHRENLAADLLYGVLPRSLWRVIDVLNNLVMAGLALFVGWRSAIVAIEATAIGERTEVAIFTIITWPSRWLVPIGFLSLALVALVQIVAPNERLQPDAEIPL